RNVTAIELRNRKQIQTGGKTSEPCRKNHRMCHQHHSRFYHEMIEDLKDDRLTEESRILWQFRKWYLGAYLDSKIQKGKQHHKSRKRPGNPDVKQTFLVRKLRAYADECAKISGHHGSRQEKG